MWKLTSSPHPESKWVSYGPLYWAGYLNGEDGANYSYSIQHTWDKGKLIYKLCGPKLEELITYWSLEGVKAFAERVEVNR